MPKNESLKSETPTPALSKKDGLEFNKTPETDTVHDKTTLTHHLEEVDDSRYNT